MVPGVRRKSPGPRQQADHWICVPAIVFSLVGLLWSLPRPESFTAASPWLNWGTLFIALAMIYYFVLSWPLALGRIVVSAFVTLGKPRAGATGHPAVADRTGDFRFGLDRSDLGHKFEGRKPLFFKDIQFLLIDPIWLLGFVYRKAGIRY